ncbi:hypothetical protein FNF29_07834 [Cafeteria roenbergensis]|uniref:Cadherin domain-containing protein n=1 Tax=Cafeteria roenbergensis TaxID=33653 RepID=A0A5A8C2N9_CAFRO|nr:hypothetical protein FNF29_07834 [Cafeteria roenbergensis]|eukprot:KAA0146769.1 hypothetical protein FNF29_07834 [Cafeteria roenbergensis]
MAVTIRSRVTGGTRVVLTTLSTDKSESPNDLLEAASPFVSDSVAPVALPWEHARTLSLAAQPGHVAGATFNLLVGVPCNASNSTVGCGRIDWAAVAASTSARVTAQKPASFAGGEVSFATYTVVTPHTQANFGHLGGVAYMGDWDGDGNGDIVVGATHISAHVTLSGGAFVVLLDEDGSWSQPGQWGAGTRSVLFTNGEGGFATDSFAANSYAGFGLAAGIDLDGNGVSDMVMCSSRMSSAGIAYAGAIRFVLLRRLNGLPWRASDTLFTAADMADSDRFPGKPTPYTPSERAFFGSGLGSAGDLDGDGVDDLLVRDQGSVFVLFLERSSRLVKDWHHLDFGAVPVAGQGNFARFRSSSDFFGDGNPDFVIPAPAASNNDGAIVIASLANGGRDVTHSTQIARGINGGPTAHPVGSYFGFGVAIVPDEDDDGLDEVLATVYSESSLYRIRLSADGTAKPGAHFMTPSSPATSGKVISSAGTSGCGLGVTSFPLNSRALRPQTVMTCYGPVGELLFYTPPPASAPVVSAALPINSEPAASSGTVSLSSNQVSFATYTVVTPHTQANFGHLGGVAYMGDWDGDGNGDIVVGATHISAHVTLSGGAFVVLLDEDGSWSQPGQWGAGTRSVLFTNGEGGFATDSFAANSYAGFGLAAGIDLDGNGVSDMVMCSSRMSSAGIAYAGAIRFVLLRRLNGLPWRASDTLFTAADMADSDRFPGKPTPYTPSERAFFGSGLGSAGDLDGDGVDDLLVRDQGSVFVLFLERSSRLVKDWHHLDFGAVPVAGQGNFARFHSSSDFFGDGNPDFVIPATATSNNDGAIVIASLANGGRDVTHSTQIARGINGGPTAHPVGSYFGFGVAIVPDEDDDGLDEVLATVYSESSLYRIRLSADGTAKPGAHFMTPSSPATSGKVISSAGTSGCGLGVTSFPLNSRALRPQTVMTCYGPVGELLLYVPPLLDQAAPVAVLPVKETILTNASIRRSVEFGDAHASFTTYQFSLPQSDPTNARPGGVEYMGDWDGDGNGDIIIGSTHITTGGARSGGAVMVLLERDGSWPHFGDWQPGSRNVVFANGQGGFQATSIPSGATAGIDFAAQIDLDNNGIDDFVVDLPLMSSAGVDWAGGLMFVLLRRVNGLPWCSSHQIFAASNMADTQRFPGKPKPYSVTSNSNFGIGLENAGDLDGDGVEDLLTRSQHAVFVLFLKRTGDFVKDWHQLECGNIDLPGQGGFARFSSESDFFGDGHPDFAISADFTGPGTLHKEGAFVVVSLADEGRTVAHHTRVSRGENGGPAKHGENTYFGRVLVSIPDQDGDGLQEVLVTSLYDDSFYRLHLNQDGTAKAGALYVSPSTPASTGRLDFGSSYDYCGFGMASFPVSRDSQGQTTIVTCYDPAGNVAWFSPGQSSAPPIKALWAPQWTPLLSSNLTSATATWPVTQWPEGDRQLTSNPAADPEAFSNVMVLNSPAWLLSRTDATAVTVKLMPRSLLPGLAGGIAWAVSSESSFFRLALSLSTPEAQEVWREAGGQSHKVGSFACSLGLVAATEGSRLATVRVVSRSNGTQEVFCGQEAIAAGQPSFSFNDATLSLGRNVGVWASSVGNVDFDDFSLSEDCESTQECGSSFAATPVWRILGGNGPSDDWFTIGQCDGQLRIGTVDLDFEDKTRVFELRLGVSPNGDQTMEEVVIATIQVQDVNEAPMWRASQPEVRLSELSPVHEPLNGSRLADLVADGEGDFPRFMVTAGDPVGRFSVDSASSRLVLSAGLDFETRAVFSLQVRAVDGRDASLTSDATLRVVVLDENEPPVFTLVRSAIPEQTAFSSASDLILQTQPAAVDEDAGQTLTYSLDEASLQGAAFEVLDAQAPTIRVKPSEAGLLDHENQPVAQFKLTATDSGSPPRSTTATISVDVLNVNEPPSVTWPSGPLRVAENSAAGTVITVIEASDPEDAEASIVWDISDSELPGAFRVAAGSLEVQDGSLLDFETAPNSGRISVLIRATDTGAESVSQWVTVQVSDVNEPPVVVAGQTFIVAEDSSVGTIVGSIQIADPDAGDNHSVVVLGDEASGNAFVVGGSPPQLLVKHTDAIDFEARTSHKVTVLVTDSKGLTGKGVVVVDIEDVDEGPSFAQSRLTGTVRFDAPSGTIILDLGLTDADDGRDSNSTDVQVAIVSGDVDGDFAVSSAGILVVQKASGDLAPGTRNLVVRATDSESNQAECAVRINVVSSNHAPVAGSALRSVLENAAAGALVGQPLEAQDEDANQSLTFVIESGDPGKIFSLDSVSGQLKLTSGGILDHEAFPSHELRVRVTDDAEWPMSAVFAVTVSVGDVNEAPAVAQGQTFHASEAAPVGTVVGTVAASDPDANDTLQFTITGGATANMFAVDGTNGELRLQRLLNWEAVATHTLQIRVQDSGGLRDEASVTVLVEDANDAPVLGTVELSIAESAQPGAKLAQPVRASDEDAGSVLVYDFVETFPSQACWATTKDEPGTVQWSPHRLDVDWLPDARAFEVEVDTTRMVAITLGADGQVADGPFAGDGYTIWLDAGASSDTGSGISRCRIVDGTRTCVELVEPDLPQPTRRRLLQNQADPIVGSSGGVTGRRKVWVVVARMAATRGADASAAPMLLLVGPGELPFTNDVQADIYLEATDSDPIAVDRVGVWAMGEGTRFSGLCHPSSTPSALARFAIDPASGAVSYKPGAATLDFETNPEYGLLVRVRDDGDPVLEDVGTLLVHVTDANDPPVWVNADPTCGFPGQSFATCLTLPEGSVVGVAASGVLVPADPDASSQASVSLSFPPGSTAAARFELVANELRVRAGATFDHESEPVVTVRVVATDHGSPPASVTGLVGVAITNVNEPPVWASAPSRSVREDASPGSRVGSPLLAVDPDSGDSIQYAIVAGGETAAFALDAQLPGQLVVAPGAALDAETTASYEVRVQATDGSGLSSVATVGVVVLDVNEAPTIEGARLAVAENSAEKTSVGAPLLASDPDRGQSLLFEVTGGASDRFGVDSCSGQVFVLEGAALDFETDHEFNITVRVTDSAAPQPLSATAVVAISILDANEPPALQSGQQFRVSEAAPIGTNASLPLAAADPDAHDVITFGIAQGNEQGIFSIDAGTGRLFVAKRGIDFESPSMSEFQIVVRVTDTLGLSSTGTVTVTASNANEAPSLVYGIISMPENTPNTPLVAGSALGGLPLASDPEGDALMFNITGGQDTGYFTINSATGQLRLTALGAVAMDFETMPRFGLNITASDTGTPSLLTVAAVDVRLVDVNDPPVVPKQALPKLVAEGALPGQRVLNGTELGVFDVETPDSTALRFEIVSGNRAELWTMDAVGGNLNLAPSQDRPLDFESVARTYSLGIRVTDNGAPGGSKLSSTFTLAVTIEDVNEPPTVVLASDFFVLEGGLPGATVGALRCEDVDAGDTHTLSILAQDEVAGTSFSTPFQIDETTGVVSLNSDATAAQLAFNVQTQSTYTFTAQCMDADELVSAPKVVTVRVRDVNDPPSCGEGPTFFAGVSAATTVGSPLDSVCTDPDEGDSLRFTVAGNVSGASAFAIDPSSGQLRIADASGTGSGTVRDGAAWFALTVTATDRGGLFATVLVIVRMTDENSPPIFTAASAVPVFRVAEAAPNGFQIGLLEAKDEDFFFDKAVTVSYAVQPTGRSVGKPFPFVMVRQSASGSPGKGYLTLQYQGSGTTALDFEGLQTEFDVVITATDSGTPALSATHRAVIEVTDSPEPPSFDAVAQASPPVTDPATGLRAIDVSTLELVPIGTVVSVLHASDPDATSQGRLMWNVLSQSDMFAAHLRLDKYTGVLTTVADVNFEAIAGPVTATVELSDPTELTARAALRVTVVDVNESPETDAETPVITSESVVPGDIVHMLQAQDPDWGARGTLRYELNASWPDAAWFRVDPLTGALSLGPARLDWEDDTHYEFGVTVWDRDPERPLSARTVVTISVTNASDVEVLSVEHGPAVIPCRVAWCLSNSSALVDMVPRPGLPAGTSSTGLFFSPLGGAVVRIVGTGFGFSARRLAEEGLELRDVEVHVTFGQTGTEFTAQDCSVTTAGTGIQCTTPPSWGGGHVWRVLVKRVGRTAIGDEAVSTMTTSAMPPRIADVTASTMQTSGGAVAVTIRGFGFGELNRPVSVTFGGEDGRRFSAQQCIVTDLEQSTVRCGAVPSGLGTNLRFVLSLAGLQSEAFASQVSYAPPVVLSVTVLRASDGTASSVGANETQQLLRTAGGDTIVVRGESLSDGSYSEGLVLTYGTGVDFHTATQCHVTVPHTELQCLSAPGVATGHTVALSVGGQAAPTASAFALSYLPPSIVAVTGVGAVASGTAGGEPMTIRGSDFGPSTTSLTRLAVHYGPPSGPRKYAAAACRYGSGHTELVCQAVPGTGKGHAITVSVAGQDSEPLPGAVSYALPVIAMYEGMGASASSTEGGQEVVVQGRNFGPLDHGAVDLVVYRQPGAIAAAEAEAGNSTDDGAMRPTDFATVDPAGALATDASATMAALDIGRVVFRAASCRVSVAHVRLTCLTVPGAGKGMQWAAVIDGQASTVPSTSYGRPVLQSVAGVPADGASTDGGEPVVLRGSNFGPSFGMADGRQLGFLAAVTYGPTRVEYEAKNCTLQSHSEIRCLTAAGVGRGYRWMVEVGGQFTDDYQATDEARAAGLVLDYAQPQLASIAPTGGPTEGGSVLRLVGSNLGVRDERVASAAGSLPALRVRFGNAYMALVSQTSRSPGGAHVVEAIVPESDGGTFDVAAELVSPDGAVLASNSLQFAYSSPRIDEQIYAIRASASTYELTAVGQNFGTAPRIVVDNVPAESCTLVVPHRQVKCIFAGRTGMVTVVTRSGQVSNAKPFEFLSPSFLQGDASTRPLLATKGGTTIRLVGLNWQTDASRINVTVDGRPCPILPLGSPRVVLEDAAENRFSLECQAPAGQGVGVAVVITRSGQPSLPDRGWAYAPPTVVSVLPSAGVATSGGRIVIHGSNFGAGGAVVLSGVDVVVESWSHTQIVALVGGGQGQALPLTVSVAQQDSSPVPFSFAPPVVLSKLPAIPTSGSTALDIVGANFGATPPTVELVRQLGAPQEERLPCTVQSFNHTNMRLAIPEGVGQGWSLVVRVGGQWSTGGADFSFEAPSVGTINYNTSMGLPTAGGTLLAVQGSSMGKTKAVLRIREASSTDPNGGIFVPANAQPSHGEAVFVLPEGQGESLEAWVEVDGLPSSPVPFSYDPPRIDRVVLPDTVPTEGTWRSREPVRHEVMSIMGSSFGVEATQLTEVRLLPAAAESSDNGRRLAHVTLAEFQAGVECPITVQPDPDQPGKFVEGESRKYGHSLIQAGIPEGYGKNLRLVVSVGGRLSAPMAFSYDEPKLTIIVPNVPAAATCPLEMAATGRCSEAASMVKGQTVRILGANFGETQPLAGELDVRIGGIPCSEQAWNRDGTLGGRPYLTCAVPWDTAGAKNVTAAVALQNAAPWMAEDRLFATACSPGAYGTDGEFCLQCPAGASCAGDSADPVALPGWFDVRPGILANDTDKEDDLLCPMERRDPTVRPHCFRPMPCEPKEACIGASLCATGYSGVRCSQCESGRYYRINGLCERCPDNPWLIVALFVVAALAACIAGYVLNQKSVNVGLLAVGVDYFQVLAIFARTRVRWPDFVKQIFVLLSAFNLNLELAAPECALPEFTYSLKWFMTMLLPLAAGVVLGLAFLVQAGYKHFVMHMRERSQLTSHADPLVAVLVVVGVFLYLILTRTTMDVFNCAPTDPPDGDNLYMSGMLDVVCFQSDTHLLLFPFAVAAAIGYVLGFPVFVAWFVRSNLYSIKYDQILRARAIPPSSKLMPREIKAFRARWHRLYYLYRPGKAYWLVVILARKFLVAVTALAFRSTPTYQLAACILVLFVAFTLQVRHTPYMSLGDHAGEVRAFMSATGRAGDRSRGAVQLAVRSDMDALERSFEVEARRSKGGKWTMADRALLRDSAARAAAATSALAEQLVDYNTVELVLLGCGILVNLTGIMFLSERFSESYGGYYQTEYDALAIIVAVVIFLSILFFLGTLLVEVVYVAAPATAVRLSGLCTSSKSRAKTLAAKGASEVLGSKGKAAGGAERREAKAAAGGAAAPASRKSLSSVTKRAQGMQLLTNPALTPQPGKRIDSRDLPVEAPGVTQWQPIRASYELSERRVTELQDAITSLLASDRRASVSASLFDGRLNPADQEVHRLSIGSGDESPPPRRPRRSFAVALAGGEEMAFVAASASSAGSSKHGLGAGRDAEGNVSLMAPAQTGAAAQVEHVVGGRSRGSALREGARLIRSIPPPPVKMVIPPPPSSPPPPESPASAAEEAVGDAPEAGGSDDGVELEPLQAVYPGDVSSSGSSSDGAESPIDAKQVRMLLSPNE